MWRVKLDDPDGEIGCVWRKDINKFDTDSSKDVKGLYFGEKLMVIIWLAAGR